VEVESDRPWSSLHVLDPLDQRIVHALQVDGRASFRRIGEVLEVSDQTVARRWTRLRTSGTVRVLGLVDPLRVGLAAWFARVRCTPDASASIGEAIARRTDTRWVSMLSGGTEIFCVTYTESPDAQDEAPLLQKLPRTPRVVEVAAHALLHVFFGQELSPVTKAGPLERAQIEALTPRDACPRGAGGAPGGQEQAPVRLGPGDRRLLEALARDGRTPAADLAAVTGWSQSTVRRRMSELRSSGALYYDLDFDRSVLGPDLRAALWLEVEPAHLAEAGTALAGHSQVAFAAATTGTANVFASLQLPDAGALYRYLTGPVAALPGIRRTETAPYHRTLKGAGPYPDPPRPRTRAR
jgi:DNA-binding Lrp family transcriptional regulator